MHCSLVTSVSHRPLPAYCTPCPHHSLTCQAPPALKKTFNDECKKNKYTTTLHAINSAVVKLGRLTVAGKVYRGLTGKRLPRTCLELNKHEVRGGIDFAFMSTTKNKKVRLL